VAVVGTMSNIVCCLPSPLKTDPSHIGPWYNSLHLDQINSCNVILATSGDDLGHAIQTAQFVYLSKMSDRLWC